MDNLYLAQDSGIIMNGVTSSSPLPVEIKGEPDKAGMCSMQQKTAYPRKKVIAAFSFCPAVGGVIIFSCGFIYQIYEMQFMPNLLPMTIKVTLYILLIGQVIFFIPAIILAWFYSYLRLYRSLKSVLFVSLMGGLGATVFVLILLGWVSFLFGSFILGATSSFLVGLLALPVKTQYDDAKESEIDNSGSHK